MIVLKARQVTYGEIQDSILFSCSVRFHLSLSGVEPRLRCCRPPGGNVACQAGCRPGHDKDMCFAAGKGKEGSREVEACIRTVLVYL